MSLTTTIKSIQDIMRKDVGVDGDAQRLGQLVWMLFLKILDEGERQLEQTNGAYISPLKEQYRWRNWAAAVGKKQKTGEQLVKFVNLRLFPALQKATAFQGDSRLHDVIQSVFKDAHNYMKSGVLLRQVIDKIEEEIPYSSFEDQKHLGEVYEKLLKDLQSAGNAGEFYTPRAVTAFVVDRIAPRLGETILDPACGTGGFLAQAVDYLRKNNVEEDTESLVIIDDAPRGIEKKPLPHMLAVTNMLLHDVKEPFRIERKNTLELYKHWSEDDKVDIVITNPPFGGMEEEGIEENYPIDLRTRETADLFIHFIYTKMLKDGGRCAIVLPDGFLFGEGIKSRIKEDLLDKCNLHTIVRLPNGVFSPYTNISTNILFFEKTGKSKDSTQTIWFYRHPYPEGRKNYSKTQPMRFEEFTQEREWWLDLYDTSSYEMRNESECAWRVNFIAEKTEAYTKAELHYAAARDYEQQKQQKNVEIKTLNTALRELQRQSKSKALSNQRRRALVREINSKRELINVSKREVVELESKAKDEQSAGDRIKYSVYNLDRNNPRHSAEEILDSDMLLAKLKLLQIDVSQIRQLLVNELTQALLESSE